MDIQSILENIMKNKNKILDDFIKSYIAETGLTPSQVKLVCKQNPTGFEYYFEELQKQTKGRKTGFENYIDTPIHLQTKEQAIAGAQKIVKQIKNEFVDKTAQEKKVPCNSPEHNPPTHLYQEPGTYTWVCPVCGKSITYTVSGFTY